MEAVSEIRLDSWKEISRYLNRGARTIQRWEQQLGLPIHRMGSGPRAPVIAFRHEPDDWLAQFDAAHSAIQPIPQNQPLSSTHPAAELNARRIDQLRSSLLAMQDAVVAARATRSNFYAPWH